MNNRNTVTKDSDTATAVAELDCSLNAHISASNKRAHQARWWRVKVRVKRFLETVPLGDVAYQCRRVLAALASAQHGRGATR